MVLDAEARRRSLLQRLGHIDDLLNRLDSAPHRLTDGAQHLLAALLLLAQEVKQVLRVRWEQLEALPDPQREELRVELCNDFHDVLQELGHTLIPALEGASASSIPVELEATVQAGARNAAPDWELQAVLFGEHQYNYSVALIRDPVGQYGRPLGIASSDINGPTDFVFLSLPRLERTSISLDAIILGHELGHLQDWYERISDSIDLPIPDEFLDEGGQLTTDSATTLSMYRIVGANWVAETVADIISFLVLGPAAILSLAELTATLGPVDTDSFTHPAADRRIKVMLGVRRRRGPTGPEGLDGLIDGLEGQIGDPYARTARVRGLDDQRPVELVWEWLAAQPPTLVARCEEVVTEEELFNSDLAADVTEASHLLARGRPCGELLSDEGSARVVRTRVILNAVWQAKSLRLEDLAAHLLLDPGSSDDLQRLNSVMEELATKSLEIAVQRRGRL